MRVSSIFMPIFTAFSLVSSILFEKEFCIPEIPETLRKQLPIPVHQAISSICSMTLSLNRFFSGRAGTPATISYGCTFLVTTAPAPTTAPVPTVTPGMMIALWPTQHHGRGCSGYRAATEKIHVILFVESELCGAVGEMVLRHALHRMVAGMIRTRDAMEQNCRRWCK
jgi:hypothetical protein